MHNVSRMLLDRLASSARNDLRHLLSNTGDVYVICRQRWEDLSPRPWWHGRHIRAFDERWTLTDWNGQEYCIHVQSGFWHQACTEDKIDVALHRISARLKAKKAIILYGPSPNTIKCNPPFLVHCLKYVGV